MSWEYNEYTKPCPCGKGLIQVTDGSNDWNQTSHHEIILCIECKEKAEKEYALKQERLSVANAKVMLVISYFREKYYNILVDKFSETRSKKDVWQIASRLGIDSKGLTSFYRHYKTKEHYIDSLVTWRNMRYIIDALKINDEIIENLLRAASEHIKEFDDERAAASYLHYKGR